MSRPVRAAQILIVGDGLLDVPLVNPGVEDAAPYGLSSSIPSSLASVKAGCS